MNIHITCRKIVRTFQYYDFDGRKTLQSLSLISNILNKFECTGTVFIPSMIFEKHFNELNCFSNIEWGAHGYIHANYTKLPRESKSQHILKIKKTFQGLKINTIGFRAPYGKINREIVELLAKENFYYDSSYVKLFEDVFPNRAMANAVKERVKKIYNPINKYYLYMNDILEIPFAVPDDEILVEMLDLNNKTIEKIWSRMLTKINDESGVFVLQLHPQRIRYLVSPLQNLILIAKDIGIHVLPLSEVVKRIKSGKMESTLCITGDIDAVNLIEYAKHTSMKVFTNIKPS